MRRLIELTHEFEIDIAFQKESIYRRNRRLVAFDMDSTLIRPEVINELARLHGVSDQVASITAAAMRGELDFRGSLRRRVALLAGLRAQRLEQACPFHINGCSPPRAPISARRIMATPDRSQSLQAHRILLAAAGYLFPKNTAYYFRAFVEQGLKKGLNSAISRALF